MNRIDDARFAALVTLLDARGFAKDDIAWSESVGEPATAEDFAHEAIFVICNSGMRNKVAARIYREVMSALNAGLSATTAFGHPGKSAAIDTIWTDRAALYQSYLAASDKVEFCAGLPFIGPITKFHLAKNFGADVAKPDVHLTRLASAHGESVQGLCERLGRGAGLRAATVDLLLWRASAEGLLDARTGAFIGQVAA